jgi:hypothetical protein
LTAEAAPLGAAGVGLRHGQRGSGKVVDESRQLANALSRHRLPQTMLRLLDSDPTGGRRPNIPNAHVDGSVLDALRLYLYVDGLSC